MMAIKFLQRHYVIAAAIAILGVCLYFNETDLAFHLAIIAAVVHYIAKKGWPGFVRGTFLMMLAAGIPFYILFGVVASFSFKDEIEHAKRGRDLIDSNRSQYEKSVDEFVQHRENGTVLVQVGELDTSGGVGPISRKIRSHYYRGMTTFMPDNLGSEPIFALRSVIKSSKMVIMIDYEGTLELSQEKDKILSEKLGIPVSELSFEDRISEEPVVLPGISHVPFYSCLIDEEGELLYLSSMEANLQYLDLTDDPIFSKIGEICEDAIASGDFHTEDDHSLVRDKAREVLGLPEIVFPEE
ncbi:hypothetical protein [Sulfitobacter sp. R18_1]|uniref:hypothetical protein n=1 Tax=Sulfitobacter sp. R18_1 TaxID=2821104 RepID=UPI001ADCEF51|nr:hypothetical protein [Sulfitobacter sp. R18_1]MBO9428830.1 hypothetical protein [Sulfitobacter sp. R18_1]